MEVLRLQGQTDLSVRQTELTALRVSRGFHENVWYLAVVVLLQLGSTSLSFSPHVGSHFTPVCPDNKNPISTYNMWNNCCRSLNLYSCSILTRVAPVK